MENKKNTGNRAANASRFLDTNSGGTPRAAAPRKPRTEAEPARRPSGFSTAGQTPRRKPAPKPDPVKDEKKPVHPKREEPAKRSDPPVEPPKKKSRRGLKVLLALALAALLALALIMIFGDRGTYHMMPTIERETEASFAPDQTPMPGVVEGL